jgi:hypothetical protein
MIRRAFARNHHAFLVRDTGALDARPASRIACSRLVGHGAARGAPFAQSLLSCYFFFSSVGARAQRWARDEAGRARRGTEVDPRRIVEETRWNGCIVLSQGLKMRLFFRKSLKFDGIGQVQI